ncbi:CPBP family intramembrane metalloprotease [Brevibacillus laterosporus]|nr:CPBP family intramembrane metalloprotease [Brevibacillus laterosporus]
MITFLLPISSVFVVKNAGISNLFCCKKGLLMVKERCVMDKSRRKIFLFLTLIVLLGIFPYYKIISAGLKGNGLYVFLLMWVPAISAITVKLLFDKNVKDLGWKLGEGKYVVISYGIPLVSAILVYSIVWKTGIGGIDFSKISIVNILSIATIGVVASGVSAIGEEIGWRGFLVPELFKKFSYTKTAIITGVIWNIYHYPPLLFSDYNNGISVLSSFIFFTISIFSITFIATWLRMKSGSMWTGIIIHASHNCFIQGLFDPITIDKQHTKLFTTEFGIGLATVYTIIAFYFWKRRDELSSA